MIFDKIKIIIIEQLGVEENEVTMDASFTDDLGADSLDVYQIVMEIESEFDIEVDEGDAEKIKTVGDAVKYIESKTE